MNTFVKKIRYYGFGRTIKRVNEVVSAYWTTAKALRTEDGVHIGQVSLFCDMLWCMLRYGADHYNYRDLKYFNLSAYGRNQYLSVLRSDRLISKLCVKGTHELFRNKDEFYVRFAPFVHHEWLIITPPHHQINNRNSNQEIDLFFKKHDVVIVKPVDSALGNGVYKLKKTDEAGISELKKNVERGSSFLLEEVVTNHDKLKAFHPKSLNTIRMVTCIDHKGEFHIVASLLRIGSGNAVIDNAKGGGMMCPIYPENGIICGEAHDMSGHRYKRHPDSGILFVGYQIPCWNDVLAYTEKLARHVTDARYVGWDIVVTENGLDVLEGNIPAGENITQIARGEGVWNELKSYV